MPCAGNNYKLLLNDQNEFGVLDMIEWKMKYIELIDNVYVLKEMTDADVWDGFKEYVGFSMEEVNRRHLFQLNPFTFETFTISKLLYVSF